MYLPERFAIYEDMGLIKSIRNDDYAYRLYDEAAIKRLEQILILRRLNINIKEIKSIFNTTGSEAVLKVLEKKVGREGKGLGYHQMNFPYMMCISQYIRTKN